MISFYQWLLSEKHMTQGEFYGVLGSSDQEDILEEYEEYRKEHEEA